MSDFQVGGFFEKFADLKKKHLSFLNDLERQTIISSTHFYHQPTFDDLEPKKKKWRPNYCEKNLYPHWQIHALLVIGGFPCQSGSKVRWKTTPHICLFILDLQWKSQAIAGHRWWSSTLLLREWQTIRFGTSFLSGVSLSRWRTQKIKQGYIYIYMHPISLYLITLSYGDM